MRKMFDQQHAFCSDTKVNIKSQDNHYQTTERHMKKNTNDLNKLDKNFMKNIQFVLAQDFCLGLDFGGWITGPI